MTAVDRSPIRVVGRYALYNEIAAGGMATVHYGRLLGPVGFARTVAVKRLHPQYAKDPEFVSMFLDEARLAARVQHPNVVATIDVVATDGELFLIMDYVRGESLSKILRTVRKSGKRVPPRIAAAIMCGFLHGLHAAHEAKNERGEPLGLVHRDVSPQNVLVGSDGIARVLAFGIAKAAGRVQVTRDGQIKGKLAYMPPEQLAGRSLTRAVDVYASAVVMWETLTTERLFKGDNESETLAKILRDPVPPPSNHVPDLPPAFDAALARALSRDASKRHATAKELALELERCDGIASPTEVGEWVETIVGHILSAREDEIAQIESNSARLTVSGSGRPAPLTDSRSDSDISSAHADVTAMHGSGQPLSEGRLLARDPAKATGPHLPATVEEPSTQTKRTNLFTSLTGTALHLPVDRKLPLLAALLGVAVLVIGLVVLLAGHVTGDADARAAVMSSASAATSLSGAPAEDTRAIPPPAEVASAEPVLEADPPPAAPSPAPPPKVIARPPVRPAAPPPPPPKAKKNCDPPWTVEANGHHRYKPECL